MNLVKDVEIHAYTYLCNGKMQCGTEANKIVNYQCLNECPLETAVYDQIPSYLKSCDPQLCEVPNQYIPAHRDSLSESCIDSKISFGDDSLIIAFKRINEV